MPTTIREQLLVGIHQTERVVSRIKDVGIRDSLAAELDAYLAEVRTASDDDEPEIRRLFSALGPLHLRIVQAAGK